MGLDMYLTKKKYLGWNYEHNRKGVVLPDWKQYGIDSSKVSYVEMEAGYWRKENAIHDWFVKNVQEGVDDCKSYYVDSSQLRELYNLCCQVLKNPFEAPNLLPTTSGFFFGSTEYDEYYYKGIEYTKELLEEILKDEVNDVEYYYHSSW